MRWREDNIERARELQNAWLRTEKGRANDQRHRYKRRANERKIMNTLTIEEWLDTLKVYNYKCVYCGDELGDGNPPIRDHIIPVSKGGNNTKENVVPTCKGCNMKKGNKSRRYIY